MSTHARRYSVQQMCVTTTAAIPWNDVRTNLWEQGYARLGSLLSGEACERLRLLYSDPACFRTRVEMERYRFGRGEYQYFAYPCRRRLRPYELRSIRFS